MWNQKYCFEHMIVWKVSKEHKMEVIKLEFVKHCTLSSIKLWACDKSMDVKSWELKIKVKIVCHTTKPWELAGLRTLDDSCHNLFSVVGHFSNFTLSISLVKIYARRFHSSMWKSVTKKVKLE